MVLLRKSIPQNRNLNSAVYRGVRHFPRINQPYIKEKNVKKVIPIFAMCIAVSGCGTDTDKVKNGVLEFNKTLTVGQALDNWKSCETRKWEEFSAENGVKVVQFTCQHKVKEYTEKVKGFLPDEIKNGAIYADIVSNIEKFQFTINKDDTFQIHNVSIETEWGDGTKSKNQQQPIKELEAAYSNKMSFDPEEINSESEANAAAFGMKFAKPGDAYKAVRTPEVTKLIENIGILNDQCSGGSGDDPKTEMACEEIEQEMNKLQGLGWCWGPDNAIEAEKNWVKCK